MNKILLLSKVLRKCEKGDNAGNNNQNGDAQLPVLITLAIAAAIGMYLLGQYFASAPFGFDFSRSLVCSFVYFLAGTTVFMWSLIRFVNRLFMSSDLSVLATMPFSSSQLAVVKFINTAGFLYIVAGFIIVPFCIGYGIESSAPISFYITSLIAFLIVPLFSLGIAGTLIIIFFSIFRFARNKDLITFIGMGITFAFMILVMFINSSSSDALKNSLETIINAIMKVVSIIPVIPFLTDFSENFNILSLFIAILISCASFLLYYIIAKFFYLKSALSIVATSSSAKKLSDSEVQSVSKRSSAVKSYAKKDMIMVRRTPAFLINGFIIPFLWPVLMFLPMILQNGVSADSSFIDSMRDITSPVHLLYSMIVPFVVAVFSAFFVSGINIIAFSSISREGKSFVYMKNLPMSYKDQIKAKRNASLSIVFITSTIYTFIILTAMCILGCVSWLSIIFGTVLNFLLLIICTDFSIISSVKRANISWENETDITKGGVLTAVYVCIAIFGTVIFGAIVGLLAFFVFNMSAVLIVVFCVLLVALCAFVTYRVEKRMYRRTTELLKEM